MRTRFPLATVAALSVIAVLCFGWLANPGHSQETGVPPAPVPADPTVGGPAMSPMSDGDENLVGAEVLTRGPVHEAFASPTLLDPEATPAIAKRPPDTIEEVPPDERPDGENVIWIPGYWAWDDERNDYLWISGLYRNAPPNQTWVPGTWSEVAGGYRWTPGFWTSSKQEEISYLEEAPPATLEAGPSSPAPSDDHFWIPGCWTYQDVRYVWRPGYWAAAQPNWVWVPARYTWCPAGYVYLPGYWDYLPEARGCLFAPVYFAQPIYYQPAFVYRPAVVINTRFFSANLFCRPAFHHYYFGDYYAVRYSNVGFRPWFSLTVGVGGRPCYDPFFSYYSWHNRRHDHDWLARTQRRYDQLRRDEHARPPHTFASYKQEKVRSDRSNRDEVLVAKSIKEVKRDGDIVKLRQVDRSDRDKYVQQATELKKVSRQRRDIEKQTDVARSRQDDDRRNGDPRTRDPKAVVKVSDKKLKLPTVAKVDSPPRDRDRDATRDRDRDRDRETRGSKAVDTARKTDGLDRTPRTTGPRVVDADRKPNLGKDPKKLETERPQIGSNNRGSDNSPGQDRGDSNPRRPDRVSRNDGPDLTKQRTNSDVVPKAVDRARSSVTTPDRKQVDRRETAPANVERRQATTGDATPRRAVTTTENNRPRTQTSRTQTNPVPRSSVTPAPTRSRTSTPSANVNPGRAARNPQPQVQIPRSSSGSSQAQPRIQSGGNSAPQTRPSGGGGGGTSRPNNQQEREPRRRSGRSADAGSPRSNIDLNKQPGNLSTITRNVDEQVKAERTSKDIVKDDLEKYARDEVRGAPRGDVDTTDNRSAPAPNDLRSPSILGPTSPNERGLTQSDSGGPALGPADGNRTAESRPSPNARRGVASADNESTRDGSSPRRYATGRFTPDNTQQSPSPTSRYESLMQQGRSLSRTNIRERPGTVDEDGNVDPRKAKNPIGSVGFGASPKRFGTPRANGPLGLSQQPGEGNAAGGERPRGSGSYMDPSTSLPRWGSQPTQQLPRMERGGTSPSRNSTGRPYDPTRGR